jgi:hypothetical protein
VAGATNAQGHGQRIEASSHQFHEQMVVVAASRPAGKLSQFVAVVRRRRVKIGEPAWALKMGVTRYFVARASDGIRHRDNLVQIRPRRL